MSHIELTECKYFKKETLERSRKMKEEWYANAQNVRKHVDYGRTAGDFNDSAPCPFGKPQPHKLVRGPDGVILVDANGDPVKELGPLIPIILLCYLTSGRSTKTPLPNIRSGLQRQ
jgi:hypothetical protein